MLCGKCNTKLELVFEQPLRRKDDLTFQYKNALGIEFITGYGMFDDPMKDVSIILCHDCAHELVEANPWMPVNGVIGHMHDGKSHLEENS